MKYCSLFILAAVVLALSTVNAKEEFYGIFQFSSSDCLANTIVGGYGTYTNYCMSNGMYYQLIEPTDDKMVLNVSIHYNSRCEDWLTSELLTIQSCDTQENLYPIYMTSPKDIEYPSNAYVIEGFDSDCETMNSYWYVLNGTTVTDSSNTESTVTYLCKNGIPYTSTCELGHGCKQEKMSLTCNSLNLFSILCAN